MRKRDSKDITKSALSSILDCDAAWFSSPLRSIALGNGDIIHTSNIICLSGRDKEVDSALDLKQS